MLSATFKSELGKLSLQDQLEVFDTIRNSVMPPEQHHFSELSPGQELELLRRAERAAADPSAGRSWAEVQQRILGQLAP